MQFELLTPSLPSTQCSVAWGDIFQEILIFHENKTKYLRLRLSYEEIRNLRRLKERLEKDLRET